MVCLVIVIATYIEMFSLILKKKTSLDYEPNKLK